MIRSDPRTGLLLAGLAIAGALTAQDKQDRKPPSRPQLVDQTLAKAEKHHRRALLTFAGADDERSAALAKAMKDKELGHLLLYEFAQATLHPLDQAEASLDFAARCGLSPDAAALPALVVLDARGAKMAVFQPSDLFGDE